MQSIWTQHLKTVDEREDFKKVLQNSTLLTNRLLSILSSKFDVVERRGFKEEDYSTAGWETLQAFRNGKLATYREIADLFDFSEKE